jgi:DNA-directed RNA polymerase specialized sigma24 family protein
MTLFNFKPPTVDGTPRLQDKHREETVLEHYSWLRECALKMTHGEREHAEDLVHDAFLQFLDKDTDLASIADTSPGGKHRSHARATA